jgi:FlaA1/EpsC-like NDP-sugar epimerase
MIKRLLQKISHRYASKWMVMIFDLIIVAFTFVAAYIIRFNFKLDFDVIVMFKQIPFVFLAGLISFLLVGSYKGVIRFTGFKDVINIIIGINILATVLIISTFYSRRLNYESIFNISGSVIYIHLLLNVLFLVGSKLFIKSIYNKLTQEFEIQKRVLIFGAGNSGMLTYDAITNDPQNSLKIIGFLDDNASKVGKKINTLPVYSLNKLDPKFIEKYGLEEVIISIQNIESSRLLQISGFLFELGLKVKIVPPVQNWIEGDLSVGQIKEVNIEDLLGRDPISIVNPQLVDEYDNKIIFITGAAGSIGSEIARKVTNYNFKKLILIDNAESALYELQQEFKRKDITRFEAVVSDVRDIVRMETLFIKYKPEIVFHAAAYKHVPLMENNPYEAINVNVGGTKNIASLSVKHGVHKFVLISTDKAVNPTNVMGATKRIAELFVNSQQGLGKTKFITTRFGNVLGSNGSVIPLFKNQIEAGGPLTVTHKDITRYFMTIPEACQLVLEAATMGNGGEIFVFDMGESVKIFDLAKNMIILSGLRYPEDIDIDITGLRPGEKIYEELLADGENTRPTYNEKIMIARTIAIDKTEIDKNITKLCQVNTTVRSLEAISIIKQIVPEYISNNSKFEILDTKKNK